MFGESKIKTSRVCWPFRSRPWHHRLRSGENGTQKNGAMANSVIRALGHIFTNKNVWTVWNLVQCSFGIFGILAYLAGWGTREKKPDLNSLRQCYRQKYEFLEKQVLFLWHVGSAKSEKLKNIQYSSRIGLRDHNLASCMNHLAPPRSVALWPANLPKLYWFWFYMRFLSKITQKPTHTHL